MCISMWILMPMDLDEHWALIEIDPQLERNDYYHHHYDYYYEWYWHRIKRHVWDVEE